MAKLPSTLQPVFQFALIFGRCAARSRGATPPGAVARTADRGWTGRGRCRAVRASREKKHLGHRLVSRIKPMAPSAEWAHRKITPAVEPRDRPLSGIAISSLPVRSSRSGTSVMQRAWGLGRTQSSAARRPRSRSLRQNVTSQNGPGKFLAAWGCLTPFATSCPSCSPAPVTAGARCLPRPSSRGVRPMRCGAGDADAGHGACRTATTWRRCASRWRRAGRPTGARPAKAGCRRSSASPKARA